MRLAPLSFPDGQTKSFKQLDWVGVECNRIEQYFVNNTEAFGLGRVLRVSKRLLGGRAFKDVLMGHLQQETREEAWDLIHYVGHSLFLGDAGYILLPGSKEDQAVPVAIENFGTYLKQARFLYLSACQTAHRSILLSMARCKIPAVLGFSCPVIDQDAEEFANEFYKQLFGGPLDARVSINDEGKQKSIQHAFRRTRRHFFENNPSETIWAHPILMLQSD